MISDSDSETEKIETLSEKCMDLSNKIGELFSNDFSISRFSGSFEIKKVQDYYEY